MRKQVFGRKFNRDINQRKALFRSLISSMIIHGQIKTTEAKAKAIKGDIEKIVTKAKVKGDQASSDIYKKLPNQQLVDKVIRDIAPKFAERPGGYTRILRLEKRQKDAARMVLLQWVEVIESSPVVEEKKKKVEKKADKKTTTKEAKKEVKEEKKASPKKAAKKTK